MTQTVNSNFRVASSSPDSPSVLAAALNATKTEIDTASAAIAIKNGRVALSAGSALAMTLAAPTAGTDDFSELEIFCDSAHAHTVTTPANKVNGNKHIITFAAAADYVKLIAYGGVWYAVVSTTTNT